MIDVGCATPCGCLLGTCFYYDDVIIDNGRMHWMMQKSDLYQFSKKNVCLLGTRKATHAFARLDVTISNVIF